MEFVAVVAMTEDRIIATEDGVPWDYPKDVKIYKNRVAGSPVIVGRTTYDSMLPNLPGASQIVLSRSLDSVESSTAVVAESASNAVAEATNFDTETVYIIGGSKIYDILLEEYDKMVITIVEDNINPNAYHQVLRFPKWNKEQWKMADIDDSYAGFRIEFWTRINSK